MNKNELIELRERLLKSEKYCLVDILGMDDDYVNLDLIRDESFLKENIIPSSDSYVSAIKYFEKSCENFIRLLSTNNISYDEIVIYVNPLFYLKEDIINNKTNEDMSILKNDFLVGDLLNDSVVINFSFEALQEGRVVRDDNINHYVDKLLLPQFTVSYSNFKNKMKDIGFSFEVEDFEELVNLKLNNEQLRIDLNFEKENSYGAKEEKSGFGIKK